MPRLTMTFHGTPDEDHIGRCVKEYNSANNECELSTTATDKKLGVVVTIDGDQYGIATSGEFCFARVDSTTSDIGTAGYGMELTNGSDAGVTAPKSGDEAIGYFSPRHLAQSYDTDELIEIFVAPHTIP